MDQSRAWFLQANPNQYDIDAALQKLDRIWWRVPQHTNEISVGDVAVIWRSGKNAGIVGVGRFAAAPQLRQPDEAETEFALGDGEEAATCALVLVTPTSFVPKERVRAIAELATHQIIVAPMGTVFALSGSEWSALTPLVAEPPAPVVEAGSALPPTFAWLQRRKGVQPMPGGYSDYLTSLRAVCGIVAEERPSPADLVERVRSTFSLTDSGARLRESFLRKIGVIEVVGGVCRVGTWAERWLESGDDRIIAALLHGRCQFIGELVHACKEPTSAEALLAVANDRFQLGWDTSTQISNRRGWLQSAGMLEATHDGRLRATPAGIALLAELHLHDPHQPTGAAPPTVVAPAVAPPEPTEALSVLDADVVDKLVARLADTATDSGHPALFEQAVRDVFAFLGYQAEWMGGAGRTDVLLDAVLGKDDTYRVIVDCKTSGSGAVSDQQVDWTTLAEHKGKHEADYVALVAPKPSGTRLFERAAQYSVTVLSMDHLVGLTRQHAKSPLGLDTYRSLFISGGRADTRNIDEQAEELQRLATLGAAVYDAIRDRSTIFGRLTARDLYLILADSPVADGTTEGEIQSLLDTFSSPLLGLLSGSTVEGYRVTTSPEVAIRRIRAIARSLSPVRHTTESVP